MIREEIKNLIKNFLPVIAERIEVEIKRPENKTFGDYSTNIALKLAKKEGKNPREVAEEIVKNLAQEKIFEKIEIAGAGFINFYLSKEFLRGQVSEILKEGKNFGRLDLGKGKKVQVEFISANPTGPLTLGNGRGGFFGDVLANILARASYQVKREYYINDAGYQIEVLGHSVLKDDKAQYKGDYIDLLNKKFTGFLKSKDPKKVGKKAADYIMAKMIRSTIERRMKIKFDEWVLESKLLQSGKADRVLEFLKQKGLTYEQDGALWFKSTQFGDDKDRVLITSANQDRGQEATYILPDAAYHYKKFVEDKFDKVIDIWGADHHGYVARLKAAKKALELPGELEIIIMQLVRLFEGGKEVKMSKRAGAYITLDELLDEIPLDVARFFFLLRSADTHMDFDLDLAREQSEKNPVYYVQYAYARIHSILAKSEIRNPTQSSDGSPHRMIGAKSETNSKFKIQNSKLDLLGHPAETHLIKQLIRLPEIIEDIAGDYQVQRLPQYALDLVRAFHKFYEECRVISEDKDLTLARLALVEAARIVLKNILDLMGISAPEKM